MKPFKSQKELDDAKREFIQGSDTQVARVDIFSLSGINKLSEEDILDRIEDIDAQSTLLRWRLWYALRKKYPSDKEFGQRIADLKATRAICAMSPQVINREMHAGRWCEEHKVDNLLDIGIGKSVIYILSSPANKGISDKIFKAIKRKNLPIKEVERLIAQETAVLTTEKQPDIQAPEIMDYDQPAIEKQHIIVEKGITQIPEVLGQSAWIPDPVAEVQEQAKPMALSIQESPTTKISYNEQFSHQKPTATADYTEESKLSDFLDVDLILEISCRKAGHLSDKEIVAELMMVAERYDLSFSKLAGLFSQCEKFALKMCA